MIELLCTAAHTTHRTRESHEQDPRCYALDSGRFCLAPCWQTRLKPGDVCAIPLRREALPVIIDVWTGDPDSPARVVDAQGNTYRDTRLYAPNQSVRGAIVFPMRHADEMRATLRDALKKVRKGRGEAARARQRAVLDEVLAERSQSRGTTVPSYRLPIPPEQMNTGVTEGIGVFWTPEMAYYLTEHPRLQAALDRLERENPRYHEVLVHSLHGGHKPAQIARLVQISQANARLRLLRGRRRLMKFLVQEDTTVTDPSGHGEVTP